MKISEFSRSLAEDDDIVPVVRHTSGVDYNLAIPISSIADLVSVDAQALVDYATAQGIAAATGNSFFYDTTGVVRYKLGVVDGQTVPVYSPQFYVNSAGSDANNGTSFATPKLTLAAGASLLTTNTDLGLSGTWRQSLTPSIGNIGIVAVTDLPSIDGSDVITAATAHATAANVWEKSWTHDSATGTYCRLTIYEDGQLLIRVADVATCSSTPGSFVDVDESMGSTVTLRFHPTGNGNPNTNGKVYEATKRWQALYITGNNITVDGLQVRRAITNDGALRVFGTNQTISRVLTRDGTKHSFLIGSGTAKDCIAFGFDPPTTHQGSNISFVSYLDDPTGQSYTYERCGTIQPLNWPIGSIQSTAAFLAHAASPGLLFNQGTIRQCWAIGPINGGHGCGAITQLEEGCYWRGLSMICATGKYTANYSIGYLPLSISTVPAQSNQLSEQTFSNCSYYFEPRISTSPPCFQLAGRSSDNALAVVLDHSNFVMGYSVSYNADMFATGGASSGSITVNNSTIVGETGNAFAIPTGVSYVGDHNIFWTANQFSAQTDTLFAYHGAAKTTLAAWQTATGQDTNSCYVKLADQAAGNTNALWLAYKNATAGTNLATIGPAVGDFRINPTARVYSGAGTAYVGTFPDGTPLIQVGPQTHWDWNVRGPVTGAPTTFPNVPDTVVESQTYCTTPLTWNFYV